MAFTVTSWKKNTPSTSVGVVTSLALHDVAIAWAITDGTAGSFTWPSGFTELKKQTCTADAQTLGVALKKDCTGSEGTLTIGCNESCVAGIIGISGADNTTQPDVTTPAAGNNNTAQASAWTITNSITPTTNGSLIVAVMGSDITASSASAVVHSFADTGGLSWTSHDDLNDGGFIKGGIGSATQATAGATTVTGTGTLAGKSAGRSLIVLAVRPAAGGGSDVSVSLTGQAITSAQGTLAPTVSQAISGQAVTSSLGTLKANVSYALSGQSAAISQGTITANTSTDVTVLITGQAIPLSQGTMISNLSYAATGQSITTGQGSLKSSIAQAISGQAVTALAGNLKSSLSYALSGQSSALSQGTLTAVSGTTASLTGQSITSAQGNVGVSVTVSISGQSISLIQGTFSASAPAGITEIIPYLIGSTASAATQQLDSVHMVTVVSGASGTVTAQSVTPFTSVSRGTSVTITLGGTPNNPPRGKRMRLPTYGSGVE